MKHISHTRGPIAWMARNSVAANLLMVILIAGGIFIGLQIKQEVFPEVELDTILISVPYPGASPAEVEQGIVLSLEEAVRSLDGIKRVTASASEGVGSVSVELMIGTNSNKALQDVKNAVDRIPSFPQDSERPIVQLLTNRFRVISLVFYGDLTETQLRQLAYQIREELLLEPKITYVEVEGVRDLEIAIEVPQSNLRAYGLTLQQVANQVARTAIELPAGGVKTPGGEILLRTAERRDFGREFHDIPVISTPDGAQVKISDIGKVIDGFRESDLSISYNGKPAAIVDVYRVGSQKPLEISEIVHRYKERLEQTLPEGAGVGLWFDASEMYGDRIDLLVRNACLGLTLVLIVLGFFLEIRLAFWVTMGIPISILGSFLMFSSFDISINMVSLFAFIVTLGIIVDDAIVVGENVYECRQKGLSYLDAAIQGARDIAMPVSFSILTNIAAFTPMLFVPGTFGKFMRVIPIIVISVFIISWVESLFVLPAHLGHSRPPKEHGLRAFIFRRQQKFSRALNTFIQRYYTPFLKLALHSRYLTVAIGISILAITVGYVGGGRLQFTFMPKVDSDMVSVNAVLPFGSPVRETKKVQAKLLETAQHVLSQNGGEEVTRGILSSVGRLTGRRRGPVGGSSSTANSHLTTMEVYLVPSGERSFSASQFANEWRQLLGDLSGLESLTFDYSTGPSAGTPIDIELSHPSISVLEKASEDLAQSIHTYSGVKDIDDGFSPGKPQFDLKVKPIAQSLGITAVELGRQVRNAFYGARAFRQQRDRDEVWVMTKLPESERRSEHDIDQLIVRTPQGGEIPFSEAAYISRGRSYTVINRTDGKRVVNITADIVHGVANAGQVLASVEKDILPGLLTRYPGLGYSLEGEQREQRDTIGALRRGFSLAMLVIFAMLAIPFKSYVQPIVVMAAIPFGIVGAILGHIIMGYDLSFISLMGIVALSGVVVNDSLVLVVTANGNREKKHQPVFDSLVGAAQRRFRPILLTSVTTFCGLGPMIFETSTQARFLIPMAISLGYGILFATVIILFIVPSLYLMVEDVKYVFGMGYKPADKEEAELQTTA